MKKAVKNIAASVRQKLLNIARESKIDFDYLLLLYVQERLLYRISCSRFKSNFVLKGGLLLYVQNKLKGRTTKDVDFLGSSLPNDLDRIKDAVEEIIKIERPDGLIFDAKSLELERIKEDADYEGIRITLNAFLDKACKKVQMDIGFGDVIVPGAIEIEYPVLMDMDRPVIMTYSLESVIAEKFEAMLTLSMANSRMKDFYDIYTLITTRDFNGGLLSEAVQATIKNRKTVLIENPDIFQESFYQQPDKIIQWNAFIKRLRLPGLDFIIVCDLLKRFLQPVYQSILINKSYSKYWDKGSLSWKDKARESVEKSRGQI